MLGLGEGSGQHLPLTTVLRGPQGPTAHLPPLHGWTPRTQSSSLPWARPSKAFHDLALVSSLATALRH